MSELAWEGTPPPKSLVSELRKRGWTLGRASPRARVVCTSNDRVPAPGAAVPWIWVSARAPGPERVVAAVDGGAMDVMAATRGWEERVLARLAESLVEEEVPDPPPEFVAESPAAQDLLWRLHRAAQTSQPVLLTGETGTGKELAARLIHDWSSRRGKAFVPINCAAIPNDLMEGELFGYTKGAFSGAVRDYDGLVMAGEGGTVFLDEIDDTPYALQMKLLRVLEDRVVSRLGESIWRKVNFRAVAATNRDLRALIAQRTFGADLHERLSTLEIHLPPLRERGEDLPVLVTALVDRFYAEDEASGRRARVRVVTDEALAVLSAYPWPGNVRELRNVIYAALVEKSAGEALLASDLPRRLWRRAASGAEQRGVVVPQEIERRIADGTMNLRAEVERLERLALEAALRRVGGNAAEAARVLGEVGRGAAKDPGGTVRNMMKRLGLGRAAAGSRHARG